MDHKTSLASLIARLKRIVDGVVAMVHEYAVATFCELKFSALQESLFAEAKHAIDAMLGPAVGDSLQQIESINRRLGEGDAEAISQALNTSRRLIENFADSVYPPVEKPHDDSDDARDLGAGKHLNRLKAYVDDHTASDTRRNRLKRAISDVHDRVCAGIHSDVTAQEARYLFLFTYVLLGELLVSDL